jgi:hypothetical protein
VSVRDIEHSPLPRKQGPTLANQTVRETLGALVTFVGRLDELNMVDVPGRSPILRLDLPIKDDPLHRFIDDAASAKLLTAVRAHADILTRIAIELLARTVLCQWPVVARACGVEARLSRMSAAAGPQSSRCSCRMRSRSFPMLMNSTRYESVTGLTPRVGLKFLRQRRFPARCTPPGSPRCAIPTTGRSAPTSLPCGRIRPRSRRQLRESTYGRWTPTPNRWCPGPFWAESTLLAGPVRRRLRMR